MPAVEVDSRPVDEGVAGPEGGGAERVELVEHPGVAAAHAARARIEPHREPLAGEAVAFSVTVLPPADLERAGEEGAVVVQPPGLNRRRLWPPRRARGQRGEILRRDGGVEGRVAVLEEGLADVVDHVVFL